MRAGRSPGSMTERAAGATRCGIDSVELARIERFLQETPVADLARVFSPQELSDAGADPGRVPSLAARFAAKEACLKLFPAETARQKIAQADFSVVRDINGAPQAVLSPDAQDVAARHRIERIELSLAHDKASASAVALAVPARMPVPLIGKLFYYLLPARRDIVLANLHRVYGDTVDDAEIVRIAQAHYAHLLRLIGEFIRIRFMSTPERAAIVRVENMDIALAARAQGKGTLFLTGHFGGFEVSTVAGISRYPQWRGRIHFVRRPIKPRWLDSLLHSCFLKAGFGLLPKRGALDAILARLEAGDAVVFPFDQYARGRDAVKCEFFGHPAGTFKSLAVFALATSAPVVPASSWREADGQHVLRFEDPLPLVEHADTDQAIRLNTRAYNAVLERFVLRHPEQWWWVHRRWKD